MRMRLDHQAPLVKKWFTTPLVHGDVELWVWTDLGILAWTHANLDHGSVPCGQCVQPAFTLVFAMHSSLS